MNMKTEVQVIVMLSFFIIALHVHVQCHVCVCVMYRQVAHQKKSEPQIQSMLYLTLCVLVHMFTFPQCARMRNSVAGARIFPRAPQFIKRALSARCVRKTSASKGNAVGLER